LFYWQSVSTQAGAFARPILPDVPWDRRSFHLKPARPGIPLNGLAELSSVSPWLFIPLLQCCPISPTLIVSKSA
jgi:hypothetical protein